MKSKLIAVVMSITMALTMIPMMGAPVYAASKSNFYSGADVLRDGSNTSEAATVHMAGKEWRVIGYGVSQEGGIPQVASSADTMTLIAGDNLKTGVQFNPYDNRVNTYKDSNLYNEVNALTDDTNGIFSKGEKEGIVPRDLEPGGYTGQAPYTNGIAGDEVEGALLWPLSTQEAYYMDSELRRASNYWWLRSPGTLGYIVAGVYRDGFVNYLGDGVDAMYGLRPAFNLNLESVIFTSANPGGKSSGDVGAGSLEQVGTNETNGWKLTLKSGHDSFKVGDVSTCDGKTVNIEYSGAVAKKGEYISAIITDENDAVKYYGNLTEFADGDSAQGVAKVTIEDKMESTEKLYIFNEQVNGDKITDYSSALNEITIPSPTGHKYGDWTRLDEKQHHRVCERDATHVEKEKHTWDAGKVTKKATEKATGIKTYTCTVCKTTKTETIPKLAKKANPLKVKGKTATVKYKKLKKKSQTLAIGKVIKFTKKGQGKITYTKASGNKKITINKKTGKVTLKKGLKKGTYKVKVKVKAAGNANFKASAWKATTVKIKVK